MGGPTMLCEKHNFRSVDPEADCPSCLVEGEALIEEAKQKERPLKVLINESLRIELQEIQRKVADTVNGYLLALGHEGYTFNITPNYDFLTLTKKKEKTDGSKRD